MPKSNDPDSSLIFVMLTGYHSILNICFFWLIFVSLDSAVKSDASGAMKTITYGAKSDSGEDISLLCGKLIPTLERLESLSEVCFSYCQQISTWSAWILAIGY